MSQGVKDMNDLTQIIVAVLGSGALSTLTAITANAINDRKTKDDDIRAGVRMSLYYQFRDHALSIIREGEVDADDLQMLQETYDIYKRLGGDGFCDSLMTRCKSLTITQKGA